MGRYLKRLIIFFIFYKLSKERLINYLHKKEENANFFESFEEISNSEPVTKSEHYLSIIAGFKINFRNVHPSLKLQTDLYGIRVMAQARKHYQKNIINMLLSQERHKGFYLKYFERHF